MNNNFHFFCHLTASLKNLLVNSTVSECFSQKKGEVVVYFQNFQKAQEVILQVNLTSDFTCINFPDQYFRAKRHTLDVFKEIVGKKVLKIVQTENDRSFTFEFEENLTLLFKMHGNRSNLILYQNSSIISVYNPKLIKDLNLKTADLAKTANYSYEHFLEFGAKKTFPTLGKTIWEYLDEQNLDSLTQESQYRFIMQILERFKQKEFYLIKHNGEVQLTMIKMGEILEKVSDPIEVLKKFYQAHFRYNVIEKLKETIQTRIQSRIAQSQQYYDKCEVSLKQLETENGPQQTADIIMANLHTIPKDAVEIELFDFYNNQNILIKLSGKESPQKFAERLYKKAKRRPIEIAKLKETQLAKLETIEQCENDLLVSKQSSSYKELTEILKRYEKTSQQDEPEVHERFKHLEFMNYQIYIGRNAANNDLLTMKFAHKDDLWLHARDVSGAHVIIKNKPGQSTPKPVIEKAAAIAAYYSERKNDSLCPVMVTEKKFVRKVKGAPKGAVKVEKEKVIMVVPSEE